MEVEKCWREVKQMVKGSKQMVNGSKKVVKRSKKVLKGKVTSQGHRTDVLYKTCFKMFESLLDIYAPLKKISKIKLKFNDEPW